MGSPLRGIDGVFKVETSTGVYTEVAYCDTFEFTSDKDEIEINKLNSTSKEFLAGLGSGSLSATGTVIWDSTTQQKLFNQFFIIDTDGVLSPIVTTNYEFEGILKQGDATSAVADEQKTVGISCALAPQNISISEDATSTPTWSYGGRVSGDATYFIRTETT